MDGWAVNIGAPIAAKMAAATHDRWRIKRESSRRAPSLGRLAWLTANGIPRGSGLFAIRKREQARATPAGSLQNARRLDKRRRLRAPDCNVPAPAPAERDVVTYSKVTPILGSRRT